MQHRSSSVAAAILLAAGMLATLPQAASAKPTSEAAPAVSAEILSAMQRDLGLTAGQVQARLAADDRAAKAEESLRGTLGGSFGGAWLADGSQVVVAVTDAASAERVRAAGAQPKVVARSESALTAIKDTLDAKGTAAPKAVTGWYVDVTSNTVVVEATADGLAAASTFAATSGAPAGSVRIAVAAEAPKTLYDIRGGDAYYIGGGRCSIGFSVNGGFVSAGHCGTTGSAVQGSNRVAAGSFAGSSFPGNDYSFIRTNSNWVPRGVVNRYSGSTTVAVRGSTESAVGASICRSGSTTGWRCGTVQAKNQTVRYSQGSVGGLTRTNACAEPGDSGGSWLSGNQAQGVTSGGSGNCSSGGTTYFQPVREILSAYGLSLVLG
ncbi:S1 family peptidase [Micromonospora sp. NBC_01796]|uniref:S1 family peptidase n=1 Tax=Micromonospora sp. NBC_01796 TaxID=2975987 RepID=UPI002DDB5972|nr:S1 family peptidase [Micromonospora sp. NBC_01796]WSA86558.1 S1 family peptidase [Micromonospora sp. NBC_01796]